MSIKTEEISSLIKKQLANYQDKVSVEETGTVTYVAIGTSNPITNIGKSICRRNRYCYLCW